MTMSIKIFDLFNDSNEIDLFIITLNKEENKLFDRKLNVFLILTF